MSRSIAVRVGISLVLCCATTSITLAKTIAKPAAPKAAEVKAQEIAFINRLVDGKKTWTPSTAVIKAGTAVDIKLTNTLPEPHGFTVPGLVDDIIVDANETKTVNVTAKTAGHLSFKCQLHPAHVGGEITVQ